jgi:hypothetical protein
MGIVELFQDAISWPQILQSAVRGFDATIAFV